jgi:hypothetical protein
MEGWVNYFFVVYALFISLKSAIWNPYLRLPAPYHATFGAYDGQEID